MSERERFESWARQRWTHPEDFCPRIKSPSRYNNYEVQAAWEAWQERAAQPAPSIPEGWKKELFCIQHAMAMNNWDWESDASNDMKRAAYAAVVRLRAATPEAKP